MTIAIYLILFEARLCFLCIIKVKIVVLVKWSFRSFQLRWVLNLEWLHMLRTKSNFFEKHVFLKFVLRSTRNYIPLNHRYPNDCYVGNKNNYLNLYGYEFFLARNPCMSYQKEHARMYPKSSPLHEAMPHLSLSLWIRTIKQLTASPGNSY